MLYVPVALFRNGQFNAAGQFHIVPVKLQDVVLIDNKASVNADKMFRQDRGHPVNGRIDYVAAGVQKKEGVDIRCFDVKNITGLKKVVLGIRPAKMEGTPGLMAANGFGRQ